MILTLAVNKLNTFIKNTTNNIIDNHMIMMIVNIMLVRINIIIIVKNQTATTAHFPPLPLTLCPLLIQSLLL